jgi:hypothetical protein
MSRSNEAYEAVLRLAEQGWEACDLMATRPDDRQQIKAVRGKLAEMRAVHSIITAADEICPEISDG